MVESKSGGLCILWKNSMSIKELEFDKNLIAVKIFDSVLELVAGLFL